MVANLKGTVLLSAAVATAIGALAIARKVRSKRDGAAFSPLYPDTTGMAGQGDVDDAAAAEDSSSERYGHRQAS